MLNRWVPYYTHSSSYRIFKLYNSELNRMIMSFTSSRKYTFSHLNTDGALWESPAINYLYTHNNKTITIADWKNIFNDFHNWTLLNELMALTSYFETYLEIIIKLAIESDPGILIGRSKCVDGIYLIKNNITTKDDIFQEELTGCVKGDWNSRIAHIGKLFGDSANIFRTHLSDLEQMRNMRNKIGHAFGRDINTSRQILNADITPMERLSVSHFLKIQKMVRIIVKNFDTSIMSNHIGNFLPLRIYHQIYPTVAILPHVGDRMVELKKKLGTENRGLYPKVFCREIVEYYERL